MVITVPIEVTIPFGKPLRDSIYISGSDYGSYCKQYEWIKRLNQMSSFKAQLIGIDSTRKTVVAEDKDIMFFVGALLQLKGKIKKCDYKTYGYCNIEGFGSEIKLQGRSLDRKEWVSSGTNDIVADICSENLDGGSPWIVETGTNMNWGNITIRGHFDDRLRVLDGLVEVLDYEWWMSQSGATYGTDIFNIGSYRGEPTSQHTFVTGSDCAMVYHTRDTANLVNDVTVLGYGDGVNQISGCATDATSIAAYGRMEKTFIDRSLINSGVAGSVANKLLTDLKDPIERIKMDISEPYGVSGLDIGDKVTIIDNDVFPGAGSQFRIVGINRSFSVMTGPKLFYELSNKSLSFTEDIAGTEKKAQKLGSYAKGSTSCYMTGETDNCDSSKGLKIDFFIPEEAIGINDCRLHYRLFKYRIPNLMTTMTGYLIDTNAYQSSNVNDDAWATVISAKTINANAARFQFPLSLNIPANNVTAIDYFMLKVRLHDTTGGSYYPTESGVVLLMANTSDADSFVLFDVPKNLSGTSIALEATLVPTQAGSLTLQSAWNWVGLGDLAVTEDPAAWGVTDMQIFVDGVEQTGSIETAKGSALTITESGTEDGSHMDITSYLVGTAGSWHSVEIRPNNKCRVVGDMYIQNFLESK